MKVHLDHHQRYLLEEFAEDYIEHRLGRRELLRRALILTGSIPAAATMLLALGCGDSDESDAPPTATTPPLATTEAGVGPGVPATDPAVVAQDASFPGPASQIKGYLAHPAASGRFPGVLVIPENQGLTEHFKDLARRFAKEGFVALSFDPISRQGGTTSDMAAITAAYRAITTDDLIADMKASVDYLKGQSFVRPTALAVTGFCFGGTQAWEITLAHPDIKAVAPYYGTVRNEQLEPLGRTQAAVLAIYGALDTRITAQRDAVEERLRAAGKPYEIKVYDGAGHAFFNEERANTGNFGYHQPSAADSWTATLAWFRRHLPSA
jgi:carboxymethylenebutenolidase